MFSKSRNQNQTGSVADNSHASAETAAQAQLIENNQLMATIAKDFLKEKRRARRWRLFTRLLIIALVALFLYSAFSKRTEVGPVGPHTALVDYDGVIGPDIRNTDILVDSLSNAFNAKLSKAVVLRINSPGGMPVQSAHVYEHIQRLRESNPEKPIYVVASDICASGCYYIAAAADKIYAHPSSIVGSIGVILNSFGFVDAMDKLGIERRVLIAGENKAILDPFSPLDEQQKQHVQGMLDNVHEQFITAVKEGRGDRLVQNEEIFSGLFWSGERAFELGLIDGFGSAKTVAVDVVGEENIVDYTYQPNWYEQLYSDLGVTLSTAIKNVFVDKSLSMQ